MVVHPSTLELPLLLVAAIAVVACGGSSVGTSTRAGADATIPDAIPDGATPPRVADGGIMDPIHAIDSGLREGGIFDARSSVCNETYDRATVRLSLPDGGRPSVNSEEIPSPFPIYSLDVRGILTKVAVSSFEISTSAFGDTTDEILRFEVTAPDLVLGLTTGVAVRVQYRFSQYGDISIEVTGLEIRDAPEGATSTPGLLLAAVDGLGPFSDSPYEVDAVALGCHPEASEGCGGGRPPDDYAFVFSPKDDPTNVVSVAMGHQETLVLNGQALRVRNLRSFQSEACDDYWNFAYFISP